MSILVLTPDREAASALCAALARSGQQPTWESSLATASGRLLDDAPSVLVLDTAIDGHGGLVQDLRALAPWARVVLIGDTPSNSDLPWIPKPFDAAELAGHLVREQELARVMQSRLLLHRQVENAERLASIGRVSAGMAHEINNPLAVIRASAAYVAMVAARGDDGELATCAEDIDVAVARIGSLVEHLAGFASQERPRIVHGPLRPALEMALRMLRAYANQSQVEVVLRTGPVVCVPHDAPRLAQALLNLLFHAVRRASQGGRRVEFGVLTSDNQVMIEVEDDGPRLSPQAAAQAFDLFSTEPADGASSGFGLSLARRIANDHGGCVWLEPGAERGARAVLALPRFNPSVYTVLVVDHDPELRRALGSELRREGFDTLVASSLSEARPLLREREIHLVLVDVGVPDLDVPLGEWMARESPRSKSLLLWSGAPPDRVDHGPSLKRPYTRAELMRVLRELCGALPFDESA